MSEDITMSRLIEIVSTGTIWFPLIEKNENRIHCDFCRNRTLKWY